MPHLEITIIIIIIKKRGGSQIANLKAYFLLSFLSDGDIRITVRCVEAPVELYVQVKAGLKGLGVPV